MQLLELEQQTTELRERGYVIVHNFLSSSAVEPLRGAAREQLKAGRAPVEFEADLRYPGAPRERSAAGGDTVRRLLAAFDRDARFAEQAVAQSVREWTQAYFGEPAVLSRAHHNCLMTKHPRFGSMTGWHRDIRYWSFEREDLISLWIAIGVEQAQNGGLWFVPGSNTMTFGDDRFDASKFFRTDHPGNAALIATAQAPRLDPGDALFFHCNTLHSAGANLSEAVKYSLVFTYHGRSNAAVAGSRSASLAEVPL